MLPLYPVRVNRECTVYGVFVDLHNFWGGNMGNLYENILELCEIKGVTIGQLCRDTGLRSGKFTDLKYGRMKTITLPTAQTIAEYFGVSTDRVLYGRDRGEGDASVSQRDHMLEELRDRKEMKMLFKTAKDATPEQIELVVKLLENMKKGNA